MGSRLPALARVRLPAAQVVVMVLLPRAWRSRPQGRLRMGSALVPERS